MPSDHPRVWLITGASSGFGDAIARAALAAGDRIIGAVRQPDALDDLKSAHPGQVSAVQLDVTDTSRIEDVVDDILSEHGHIDVLVNNAGHGLVGAVEETTDDELRDLMDLHFFGPAALTRAILPSMRERRSGTIVQISSMGGRMTLPGVGAYSATKFALEGWSEALAAEVKAFGITVLIVEPGAFRTGFNGGGLQMSKAIDAYEDLLAPVRANFTSQAGQQPGDPDKAAAAILQALEVNLAPLRLPLGSDAADALIAALAQSREEIGEWEKVSRGTDF